MQGILLVLIFSLIGGIISMIGGLILSSMKRRPKLLEYATAFAAGALLAAAFVDLIPEAFEHTHDNIVLISIFILCGVLVFFLLENFIHWFHSHRHHDHQKPSDPIIPLIIIGDTVHNFVDGIAIAAGFLIDPVTGIIVTLAVAAHEIPQEIGDFGLLLSKGLPRSKVILINALSALATTIAAVAFFIVGDSHHIDTGPVLALVAGFFIYIAVSDIIPSIHEEKNRKFAVIQSLVLLTGVLIVGLCVYLLHGLAE